MLLADVNFKDNKMIGVHKKYEYIYIAIKNNNIDVDYVYRENNYLLFRDKNGQILRKIYITTQEKYNIILNKIIEKKYDFIIIRYILSDIFLINFIKKIKKIGIKIVLEFPTFPYEKEISNNNILDIDKYFREELRNIVDLSVTYNNVGKIFGIPNIFIGNGIDVKAKKILKYKPLNINSINIIGVANVSKWHGYDRVISGISDYISKTNKRNINFWIIGNGDEVSNLNNLAFNLKVEENIKFFGFKEGEELEKIYSEADIGIGPLSRKRIEMNGGSALKNREYCAIGLPFIFAGYDPDFDQFKYSYKIEDDETPVNIMKVLEFLKKIKNEKEQYIFNMRKYAEDNLEWSKKIKEIINKLYSI